MNECVCTFPIKSITFFPVSSGLSQSGSDLELLCGTGLLILDKSCQRTPRAGTFTSKNADPNVGHLKIIFRKASLASSLVLPACLL